MSRTWTITDEDGIHREVTLSQFRAMIDARKQLCQPIADAWKAGDQKVVTAAQQTLRNAISKGK